MNLNPDYISDAQNALVYYKGPFYGEILSKISDFIKNDETIDPFVGGRLFAIFIELAQNIARYSWEFNHLNKEERHGVGFFAIFHKDNEYILRAGNLLKKEKADELVQRCMQINELDKAGLKELRKSINRAPRNTEKSRGGNIGLIKIALKSEHPLHTSVTASPHEGLVHLTISTVVSATV